MFFNIIYYFMKKSPVIGGFGMSLENINNKIQFNKENLKTIYLQEAVFGALKPTYPEYWEYIKQKSDMQTETPKIQLMKKYVTLIQNMQNA